MKVVLNERALDNDLSAREGAGVSIGTEVLKNAPLFSSQKANSPRPGAFLLQI